MTAADIVAAYNYYGYGYGAYTYGPARRRRSRFKFWRKGAEAPPPQKPNAAASAGVDALVP